MLQTSLNLLVHWLAVCRPYWIPLVHFSYLAMVTSRYFRQRDSVTKFSLRCQPFSWFHRSGSLIVVKSECHAHAEENKEDMDILEWVQWRVRMSIWSTEYTRGGWESCFFSFEKAQLRCYCCLQILNRRRLQAGWSRTFSKVHNSRTKGKLEHECSRR